VFIGEPAKTQADIHFSLGGIPVRVSIWFWVAAAILGWGFVVPTASTPSHARVRNLIIWVTAVFLSILIHELGHVLAHRLYGIGSRIVLYYLGGLAIPDHFHAYHRTSSQQQIAISAAGPALQIGTAFVLMSLIAVTGYRVPLSGFVAGVLQIPDRPPIPNVAIGLFAEAYLYVSVYWALMNLLPVYPLDGGMISRELFLLYDKNDAVKHSIILSIAVAALIAIYSLTVDQRFMFIMFASLAVENYMALLEHTGGRFRRGSW
jgi:Zn-dependent protease